MGTPDELWYQSHQPGVKAQVDSFRRLERLCLPESMDGYRVLDIGCNEGFFCHQAVLRGAREVIGIDVDDIFLGRAQALYGADPKITFLKQSWQDLPGGEFDLILWTSAMHYEPSPYSVLANIASRLSRSGVFVLECGVHPDDKPAMVRSIRHDGCFWYPTRKYLESLLRKAGFAFRVVSEPENIGLDPVPRIVYHCTLLKTNIVVITGETKTGKSYLADQLSPVASQTISLDFFVSRIAASNWAHSALEQFIKATIDRQDLRKLYVALDEQGYTEEYIRQVVRGIQRSDELVVIEGFMTGAQIDALARLVAEWARVWVIALADRRAGK